jgi:hypothetical protein
MRPNHFDPVLERRAALLVWLPLCVLIFPVALGYALVSLYGLDDPWALAGAGAGLVAAAPLVRGVARRWRRPLTHRELAESRGVAASLGQGRFAVLTVAGWLALNGVLALAGANPFPLAFLWTFTTACTVLGILVVAGRRGLYQSRGDSLGG